MMKTSKIFTILKTFSREELKRFGKFIESPYHNSGRNLKPLLKVITKNHPEYPQNKLTDEKILKALKMVNRDGRSSQKAQLNVRFSELTKLAGNFAVAERSLNSGFSYSKTLAEFYLERDLFGLCRSEINQCNKILNANGIDEIYALERLLLQRIISLSYHKENKKDKALKELKCIPLYALSYFVTNVKVQLYSNHLEYPVNYDLLKKITDSLNIDELAGLCEDDSSGLINKMLYDYKRCQFYLYEDPDIFNELIGYYKLNFEVLSDVLKWQYFLGLMKSGTQLMGTVNFASFGSQLNQLIDFVFDKGLFSFSRGEPLEDVLFTSIIKIKFAILSTKEIHEFSGKYIAEVKPEFRNRALNYANAFLSFKKGEFEKALDFINLIPSATISEKNNLYKLKIAVYYELNYTEELYYLLDSYSHFISKNTRFSKAEGNYGFSDVIKRLISHRSKNIKMLKNERTKILESIRTSEFEWWLIQKLQRI